MHKLSTINFENISDPNTMYGMNGKQLLLVLLMITLLLEQEELKVHILPGRPMILRKKYIIVIIKKNPFKQDQYIINTLF